MFRLLLRHNLLWLIMAVIFVNGLLSTNLAIRGFFKTTSKNHSFEWNSQNVLYPGLDMKHFASHEFQKYVEDWAAKKLRKRDIYIGLGNQLYFSLFKKSFTLTENNNIVVGKDNQLFQLLYILAYCHLKDKNYDQHKLVSWADKIKQLSDFFEKRGQTFIYLITPSKAEYLPSAIPKRFPCSREGISSHVLQMVNLLEERKVRYVNCPSLMSHATQQYGIAMFPKGGIHWNWLGSSVGANAIIDAINQDNHIHLNPIRFGYTLTSPNHQDGDDDLLKLMKLLTPFHYKIPKINYLNDNANHQSVKVAFIGGSFIFNLIDIYKKNKTFSNMKLYSYFNRIYDYDLKKKTTSSAMDPTSMSVLNSILGSDVVILEENSSLTMSEHGKLFFDLMKKSALII